MIQMIATLHTMGIRMMDRREELLEKLNDDAGLTTAEYVILGSLVLAAVVTVGAVIVSKLNEKGSEIGNL